MSCYYRQLVPSTYDYKRGKGAITCLEGSMVANPPLRLDWPPFLPMFCTSSRGRLEKFPGLELSVILYCFESFERYSFV